MCEDFDNRPQISIGKLIKNQDLTESFLIPEQAKAKLVESKYYLSVSVPGESILKISIFATKHERVMKILIELDEFTPVVVEGIGNILTENDLCDFIIHTSGLCFSESSCYYESYIDVDQLKETELSLEILEKKFKELEKVKEVDFINITY